METLATLEGADIRTAGAGRDASAAAAPAVLETPGGGRVVVVAACTRDSGVPPAWEAGRGPGVRLLPDLSDRSADALADRVRGVRRAGDVVVASIHWGGNWAWGVPDAQRRFAHRLVERGGVHVVHGHSSHHVRGIEVHRGRLILYGCGDLIDDYEGIGGHEGWRGDLRSLYLATLEVPCGRLVALEMAPMRMRRLRLRRAGGDDGRRLRDILTREGRQLGTTVEATPEGRLALRWPPP